MLICDIEFQVVDDTIVRFQEREDVMLVEYDEYTCEIYLHNKDGTVASKIAGYSKKHVVLQALNFGWFQPLEAKDPNRRYVVKTRDASTDRKTWEELPIGVPDDKLFEIDRLKVGEAVDVAWYQVVRVQ